MMIRFILITAAVLEEEEEEGTRTLARARR